MLFIAVLRFPCSTFATLQKTSKCSYLLCVSGTLSLPSVCLCSQPTLSVIPAIPTQSIMTTLSFLCLYLYNMLIQSALPILIASQLQSAMPTYSLLRLTYVISFLQPSLLCPTNLLCLKTLPVNAINTQLSDIPENHASSLHVSWRSLLSQGRLILSFLCLRSASFPLARPLSVQCRARVITFSIQHLWHCFK